MIQHSARHAARRTVHMNRTARCVSAIPIRRAPVCAVATGQRLTNRRQYPADTARHGGLMPAQGGAICHVGGKLSSRMKAGIIFFSAMMADERSKRVQSITTSIPATGAVVTVFVTDSLGWPRLKLYLRNAMFLLLCGYQAGRLGAGLFSESTVNDCHALGVQFGAALLRQGECLRKVRTGVEGHLGSLYEQAVKLSSKLDTSR